MNAISNIAVRGILSVSALALCSAPAIAASAYTNHDRYDNTAWNDNYQANTRGLERNRITTVGGIDVSCTGIGEGARANAPVNRLPVKLEVVGGYGQYLAGETVTLKNANGERMLHTTCDAPWLMMKLPAGRYTAKVSVPGAPAKTVAFNAPRHGGRRSVVVRFSSLMAGNPQHSNWQG
jgi:hypothetical protein